jgi:hypothetical protein
MNKVRRWEIFENFEFAKVESEFNFYLGEGVFLGLRCGKCAAGAD